MTTSCKQEQTPGNRTRSGWTHDLRSESNKAIELNHNYLNVRFKAVRYHPFGQSDVIANKHRSPAFKISLSSEEESNRDYEYQMVKKEITEKARSYLLRNSCFSINELYKQAEQRKKFEDELKVLKLDAHKQAKLMTISRREFQVRCKADKYQSSIMQSAIEHCSQEELAKVSALIIGLFEDFLVDKYGNYILQQAVKSLPATREHVEAYCTMHLEALVIDEYASRVMQCLTQVSKSFRRTVFTFFSSKLHPLIENLSSIFLLTSAIYYTESDAELGPVKTLIFHSRSRPLLQYKYFKRIVMAFVEKSEPAGLDLVWKLYKFSKKFASHLEDKFGALLVSALIQREHPQTLLYFNQLLNQDIGYLYGTKYFKFLFYKLVTDQGSDTVKRQMLYSLLSMDKGKLAKATKCPSSCVFFAYLVANLLPVEQIGVLFMLSQKFDRIANLRLILQRLAIDLRIRYN